jgi:hypothetical protein
MPNRTPKQPQKAIPEKPVTAMADDRFVKPAIERPSASIMRFAQTIGASKTVPMDTIPAEEQAFLDDLEAVLAYLAAVERQLSTH